MRVLKWAFAALALCGLAAMWFNRAVVVDAYTTEREPLDFSLDGLDLEVEPEARTASPFAIPPAPDTRRAVLDVSVDPGPVEPVRVDLAGGSATLRGTVVGPGGVVPGAVVLVERHTLDGVASVEVSTDVTGAWTVSGIQGGRYRIRGFLPGLFATDNIEVFFLDEKASVDVPLRVVAPRAGPIVSLTAPSKLEVGTEQVVAVSVGYDAIDENGRRILTPSPGRTVEANFAGVVELLSSDQVTTDGFGAVRFRLRCQQAGANSFSVRIDGQSYGLALPSCTVKPLEVSPVNPEDSESGESDDSDSDSEGTEPGDLTSDEESADG